MNSCMPTENHLGSPAHVGPHVPALPFHRFKLIVGIFIIFIFGALAGSLGTHVYFKHRVGRFARGERLPIMHLLVKKLSHELDLTETQQSEIEKIVEQSMEIDNIMQKYHPEVEKIIDSSMALIKEKLNEEQKKKLDELHDELKMRGRMGPRGIFPPPLIDRRPDRLFAIMEERLKLTKEQYEKVHPIIDERMEKQRTIFEEYGERGRHDPGLLKKEMQALEEATKKQLESVLTEEQIKEYQKIQEEHHQEMHAEMRPRRFP